MKWISLAIALTSCLPKNHQGNDSGVNVAAVGLPDGIVFEACEQQEWICRSDHSGHELVIHRDPRGLRVHQTMGSCQLGFQTQEPPRSENIELGRENPQRWDRVDAQPVILGVGFEDAPLPPWTKDTQKILNYNPELESEDQFRARYAHNLQNLSDPENAPVVDINEYLLPEDHITDAVIIPVNDEIIYALMGQDPVDGPIVRSFPKKSRFPNVTNAEVSSAIAQDESSFLSTCHLQSEREYRESIGRSRRQRGVCAPKRWRCVSQHDVFKVNVWQYSQAAVTSAFPDTSTRGGAGARATPGYVRAKREVDNGGLYIAVSNQCGVTTSIDGYSSSEEGRLFDKKIPMADIEQSITWNDNHDLGSFDVKLKPENEDEEPRLLRNYQIIWNKERNLDDPIPDGVIPPTGVGGQPIHTDAGDAYVEVTVYDDDGEVEAKNHIVCHPSEI